MPIYRGISLSVMSQWDSKQIPEFIHPDSPDLEYGVVIDQAGVESQGVFLTSDSVSKADRILGRNPSISCYIPSLPGVQFFLKFYVEPPHPDGQYLYFKLFMNGYHIASWGVTPRTDPEGYVTRALFEADEKWDLRTKRGKVFKHNGVEERPFLFTEERHGMTDNENGGLIEVQVFRSRGRRRRAPLLERFRPQEQYGIQLPGVGLVENPQDMKYFEWVLVDPKDLPYATFFFHYRTLDYLQSHQLISHSHTRTLLHSGSSLDHLQVPQEAPMNKDGDDSEVDDDLSFLLDGFVPSTAKIKAPCHPTIFDDGSNGGMHPGSRVREEDCDADFQLSEDGDVLKQFRALCSRSPVTGSSVDGWKCERPLPELPVRRLSLDICSSSAGHVDHSRKSSTSSSGIPVTPTLLPWLDRGSNNSSPEHFIGVATAEHIPRPAAFISASLQQKCRSFPKADRHTDSPSHPTPFFISERITSPEATSIPPNVTIRKSHRNFTTEKLSRSRICIEESDNEAGQDTGSTLPFRGTNFVTSETGTEQTFSPTKRNHRGEPLSDTDKGKARNVDIDQSWAKEKKRAARATNEDEDRPIFYSHRLLPRPGTPHFTERGGNWI